MLASVSNQLIVWDVQTGDLTRIINPNIEGIFLGMALSKDDKYSVAYTNNNQVSIDCIESSCSTLSAAHRDYVWDFFLNSKLKIFEIRSLFEIVYLFETEPEEWSLFPTF